MSIRLPLTIAGLAVAAFAALSLHALRSHSDPSTSPDAMHERPSADATAQADASLPDHAMPAAMARESENREPARQRPIEPAEPIDSTQAAAQVEAHIATLDNRFVAEPLNADWARTQEGAIRAFFQPGALAAEGLSAPSAVQTVCHSLTCRVSAEFTDVAQAETTTQHLAMHLAERLPYGAVMPRQLDDGSIQVHAWYSAARIEL